MKSINRLSAMALAVALTLGMIIPIDMQAAPTEARFISIHSTEGSI